jgi:hypothetical protein
MSGEEIFSQAETKRKCRKIQTLWTDEKQEVKIFNAQPNKVFVHFSVFGF